MIWNQKMFEKSSENKGTEPIETEDKNEEKDTVEEIDTPVVEKEETVIKEEKKETPKTPKQKETPKIEKEEKPVVENKDTNNLELENRILKKSISTGFDAELLTALVLQNIATSEDGTDNLDDLVNSYVEKYPQMLANSKTKPKATPGIEPSETDSKNKQQEQYSRYFGSNGTNFFKGSGLRT